MNIKVASLLERNTFLLSLLFHLLLFSIYLLLVMQHHVLLPEKRPALYVPSYLSNVAPLVSPATKMTQHQAPVVHEKLSDSVLNQRLHDVSLSQQQNVGQYNPVVTYKREQPVYMIGEKLVDDPLKKLLGTAISRHLYYPEAAQALGMQGVVAVGFTLFPDGTVMNAQVMHSSHKQILDAAAMAAVREMSPVDSVDIYLQQPKFLVVNVIFR